MASISFLANGKPVRFKTEPKRKKKVKLSGFAAFVQKNGKAAAKDSKTPQAAMKKLARDYKRD
jgi:hypothetical protein